MKFLKKSALSLSAIVVSGLSMSNPVSAQYPNQMQIYQAQCQQGYEFACSQLDEMRRRNREWKRGLDDTRRDIERDQEDINIINRQKACRRGSYSFNDSHCNYVD